MPVDGAPARVGLPAALHAAAPPPPFARDAHDAIALRHRCPAPPAPVELQDGVALELRQHYKGERLGVAPARVWNYLRAEKVKEIAFGTHKERARRDRDDASGPSDTHPDATGVRLSYATRMWAHAKLSFMLLVPPRFAAASAPRLWLLLLCLRRAGHPAVGRFFAHAPRRLLEYDADVELGEDALRDRGTGRAVRLHRCWLVVPLPGGGGRGGGQGGTTHRSAA